MGNSKSKNKKPYLDDMFFYDDYAPYNNQSSAVVEEVPVDFDKLPTYTLPHFLKGTKELLAEKEKEFSSKKTFDAISVLDLMNNILTDRDSKEERQSDASGVWASGVGFGGGSMDDYGAKKLRDQLYTENLEREYVLIRAFSLFSTAISSTPPKMQRRVRRIFNRSAVRTELGDYLINNSMLDINKHALFYWHSWRMLMAFASSANLRGCIFRGSFYLHMQKLIDVAVKYKTHIDNMPAKIKHEAPAMRLVNEIIASRPVLERQYASFKEEKITPLRDSNSAVSTIDVANTKSKKVKQISRKQRANTMFDVSVPKETTNVSEKKKEISEEAEVVRTTPLAPRSKKGKKKSQLSSVETEKETVDTKERKSDTDTNSKEEQEKKCVEEATAAVLVEKKKKKRRKKKKLVVEQDPYLAELMPLIFDSCPFPSHLFSGNSSNLSNGAINRTMLEIQSLADSLPSCLTPSSGIFLRTNDEHIHLMKGLIIGPPGTPYSLGLFEFDIMIPDNYPQKPPLCKIVTTGNQSFRFNPNLYANGKVCLSLIGTWSGAPEEQWDPKVSTLLQMFISIQSLILVENPYYNEPGYQFSPNDVANEDYNRTIRAGTTRIAILGQLQDKKSVFKDIIQSHCRSKKEEILLQCKEWNISQNIVDDLTKELNNL